METLALWAVFIAAVLGLTVGSFLNVVIYRLPKMLYTGWYRECKSFLEEHENSPHFVDDDKKTFNIAFPNSHCPSCQTPIKAWQNIPVVSYLLLGGQCAHCGVKISVRYPIVELVSGLLSAFVIFSLGLTPAGGLALVFTWSLLVLTLIDADHQLLPDNITLPLLWIGLLANTMGVYTDLESAVYGAVFGYLSLWSVYWLFKLITGKEGMGFGDFKLLAALGAWLGWQQLPLIIILSSFVGAVYGVGSILITGKDKSKPIPFGPYLAVAGWIAFFWGETITAAYLSTMS